VETSFSAWIVQKVMFLRDKDWAGVVKTIHFPPSLFLLWGETREKRVSAQAKPISDLIKDFEQSLEGLRPSTRRVYVAGAKAALRSANLELWQSYSSNELLALIRESPTEKRISPFLAFLDDEGPKNSLSDDDSGSAKLGDSDSLKSADPRGQTAFAHKPARPGVDRGNVRRSGQRYPSKMASKLPQSQGKPSASLGRAHPGTGSRSCLALLARLAGAARPTRPTTALP
jgi:hypothetical protein